MGTAMLLCFIWFTVLMGRLLFGGRDHPHPPQVFPHWCKERRRSLALLLSRETLALRHARMGKEVVTTQTTFVYFWSPSARDWGCLKKSERQSGR